ncbi:MAG TPA: hypothetical protein PLB89_02290 [Flavobacteriales bacterium]|nr:hypothetical protein [Flavobacteriales bacterium]
MRHVLLSLVRRSLGAGVILLLAATSLRAQAPVRFSYQAVVRDANDDVLADMPVGMRISILQGSINGTAVYVETHTPSTNASGLVSVQVGAGAVQSGSLNTIDWGAGPYFIKSETDPNGGGNYTISGTQEMLSVPYALFAANSVGGAFTTTAGVDHNTNSATNDFAVGSSTLDNAPGFDDDGRMFFDKSKAAFRVGTTNSTQWDAPNVGGHSFATGQNTQATGSATTAMGEYTVASGTAATAIGAGNTASGDYSLALGEGTTAPSKRETVLGSFNNTAGYSGDATSWEPTDRLLTVGNGSSYGDPSNALVILKNGNTGIGTDQPTSALDIDGAVRIRGGSPGAGKVLTSAADGSATWQVPTSSSPFQVVVTNETLSCTDPPCVFNNTIMATCPTGYVRVSALDLYIDDGFYTGDLDVVQPGDDLRSIGVNYSFSAFFFSNSFPVRLRTLCAGGFPIPE